MQSQGLRRRLRIALFVDTLNHAYQNAVLLGAHQVLGEADADLYCLAGGGLQLQDVLNQSRNSLYDLVGAQDFDGYIVSSTITHALSPEELRTYCARFVPAPVCLVGDKAEGISSVLIDDARGVRELTSHLIRAHGRARIAFLGGPESSAESRGRHEGYRLAHEDNGLTPSPELCFYGDFSGPWAHEAVAQIFDRDRTPCDAVVAANDVMAIAVMAALDERGIRVPEQVAVVGFDDSEQARFTTPPLSTVNQQIEAQSATAARLVLTQLAAGPRHEVVQIATTVVLRQSCGCLHERSTAPSERPALDAAIGGSLDARHESLALGLAGVAPTGIAVEVPEWREHLVDALLSDERHRSEGKLLTTLDSLLRRTARHGDVNAWHAVINVLQNARRTQRDRSRHEDDHTDTLLHEARRMIGVMAERVQARRRLAHESTVQMLQELSAALRTCFDEVAFATIVTRRLPLFGVSTFYIALQEGSAPSSASPARLLVACSGGAILVEPGAKRRFRCGDLVPADLLGPDRRTLAVEPLFFGDELLGFGLFELGPLQSSLYEELREHISTALKGVRLFEQLLDEATRRQRAEKDRLESELALATRIQTAILPRTRQVVGLEIAARMIPATEVGGDYFDILPFDGGSWIGIGDVVGHGLPAGLLMLMIQSLVAATVNGHPDAAPAEVWRTVNAVLCENIQQRLGQDEYATLTILRYDIRGKLTFAGAHEDLIVCRAATGRCEVIATPGTWAGLASRPGMLVPASECSLEPGDVLLLYTDGVTEAMSTDKIVFGQEELCRELESVRDQPADVICAHLLEAVEGFSAVQSDDRTLLVAKYVGASAPARAGKTGA